MEDDVVRRQLLDAFLGELDEHVRILNADLLVLEADPTADVLHRMLRSTHSLKGASAAMRLRPLERVCHWIEDRLSLARDGLLLEAHEFQSLFAAVDAMQDAAARIAMGDELGDVPLLPWLEQEEPQALVFLEDDFGIASPPADAGRGGPLVAEMQPEVHVAHASAAAAPEAAYLRVPVSRLDALYSSGGELARARLRYQSSTQELREITDRVAQWQVTWRSVESFTARARRTPALTVPSTVLRTLEEGNEELRQLRQTLEVLSHRLLSDNLLMQGVVGRLQSMIASVRLQPFGECCQGLERVVRDVSRSGGKEVALRIEGSEVELDRSILAALRDPLLHLVRNAVDHGIEPAAERTLFGKPEQAQVTVTAQIVGARVEVCVEDDGRGLDLDAIRAKAQSKGWPLPQDEAETVALMFRPGFSTARAVTDVSGRGVGLDVVKSQLEALGGAVDVNSRAGLGTRFTLRCPLTLTSLRVLLLRLGTQVYAIPSGSVERVMRVHLPDVRRVGERSLFVVDGRAIPVVPLSSLFEVAQAPLAPHQEPPGILLGTVPRQIVLLVDDLLAEQEVTVQGLGPRIGTLPFFSGASVLADGRILLILNAAALINTVLDTSRSSPAPLAVETPPRRRLLVADDSATVRALEKSLLESAGYDVVDASDGQDAWEKLGKDEIDLVVADVEMPRSDGLELVRRMRESSLYRELPVILVTSMGSDEQKAAGMKAGASAYVVKSGFDQQQLLDIIGQLL